jgi:DNA-binding LacI/PurR family transcriptional regulator
MAGWPLFDLTTYGQPMAVMAEHVVETIRMQLDGESEPTKVVVPGELVVRGSARVPKWGVSGPPERRIWTPDK